MDRQQAQSTYEQALRQATWRKLRHWLGRRCNDLLSVIGEAYLVEDGNHRISVAQMQGQETIEAHVIEIDATSLTPDHRCTRLGYNLPHPANCS